MTRINCIPVQELSGPHLVAEYRELPRIFTLAQKAAERLQAKSPSAVKRPALPGQPSQYTLGTGHVLFFYTRLGYLSARHRQLVEEMKRRGYQPSFDGVQREDFPDIPDAYWQDWVPDDDALALNRERIELRTQEAAERAAQSPRKSKTTKTPALPAGKLYLVSAGIGDPDNITVKAQNILRQAEVIFISTKRREAFAELLAGKALHDPGHGLFTPMQRRNMSDAEADALEQETQTIIRSAIAAGKIVAVVDYGDPTLYGPQLGYLQAFRDLHPVVIPGISSFNAANAALATGITSGKHSQSVILTVAKAARDGYEGTDSLTELARSRSAMAFFTMRLNLPQVLAQLKTQYPGDTPIAIVMHAGVADKQEVIKATLDTLPAKAKGLELPFEHLIYVGDFLSNA